jgi:hypothetical protein
MAIPSSVAVPPSRPPFCQHFQKGCDGPLRISISQISDSSFQSLPRLSLLSLIFPTDIDGCINGSHFHLVALKTCEQIAPLLRIAEF